MRIAFLVNAFPVPSETFIIAQIEGLRARGHEVRVYGAVPDDPEAAHREIERLGLAACVHHHRRRPRSAAGRSVRALSTLLRHPFRLGAIARAVDPRRFGAAALRFDTLADVEPFLDAPPHDLLACHFGPNGVRGVDIAAALASPIPVVTTFHGYDLSAFRGRGMPGGYGRLFRRGALFLPVSQYWHDLLIQLGCPPERTRVHRMGVDLGRFRFTARTRRPDQELAVISVARLVEKKGLELGIRAVKRALDRGRSLRYDILGDGPLREPLLRLIAELGVGERVHLRGWADRQRVAAGIERAHVFLAPSVTAADGDKEGIPVVLMEAMATGLPVIASNHSGIPELVHDGDNGSLVPEGDVEALARALVRLYDEPERLPSLGRAGRAAVERDHDNERQNDRLEALFAALVRAPDAPPVAPSPVGDFPGS